MYRGRDEDAVPATGTGIVYKAQQEKVLALPRPVQNPSKADFMSKDVEGTKPIFSHGSDGTA